MHIHEIGLFYIFSLGVKFVCQCLQKVYGFVLNYCWPWWFAYGFRLPESVFSLPQQYLGLSFVFFHSHHIWFVRFIVCLYIFIWIDSSLFCFCLPWLLSIQSFMCKFGFASAAAFAVLRWPPTKVSTCVVDVDSFRQNWRKYRKRKILKESMCVGPMIDFVNNSWKI